MRVEYLLMSSRERSISKEEYEERLRIQARHSIPEDKDQILAELERGRIEGDRYVDLQHALLEITLQERRVRFRAKMRARGLDTLGLPLIDPNTPRLFKDDDQTKKVRRPRSTQ